MHEYDFIETIVAHEISEIQLPQIQSTSADEHHVEIEVESSLQNNAVNWIRNLN